MGWITCGGYGYTLGKMIGYGYVRRAEGISDEFLSRGEYALEVATRRVPAKLSMQALWDPKMERVKA